MHIYVLTKNIRAVGTTVVRFNSTREDGARAMDVSDPAWTKLMPGKCKISAPPDYVIAMFISINSSHHNKWEVDSWLSMGGTNSQILCPRQYV